MNPNFAQNYYADRLAKLTDRLEEPTDPSVTLPTTRFVPSVILGISQISERLTVMDLMQRSMHSNIGPSTQ